MPNPHAPNQRTTGAPVARDAVAALAMAMSAEAPAPPTPELEFVPASSPLTQSAMAGAGSLPDTRAVDMSLEENVPDSVSETTRVKILQAAHDMSLVQALAPREKDFTGFSNADYAFGAVASAEGNTRACALLLMGYPRQVEGYGLTSGDLAWAKPSNADPDDQYAARVALSEMRETSRGQMAWAEKGGKILIVPYTVNWADRRVLRQFGAKTPMGFEIDKDHLGRVLENLTGTVINKDTLHEIAKAHRVGVLASGNQEAMAALCNVQVNASRVPNGGWKVNYSDPLSPEGLAVKEAIKKVGGVYDGTDKTWAMSYANVQMLTVMVSDIDGVDPTALPVHPDSVPASYRREAELLTAGVLPVRVKEAGDGKVVFGVPGRSDILYQACAALKPGIRWDSGLKAYDGQIPAILKLLEKLETEPSLDLCALAKAARRMAKEESIRATGAVKTLEGIRLNTGDMAIPELTLTGRKFYPHQPEGIRHLLVTGLADPNVNGAILADDMGLGKTVEAVMAAYLKAPEGRKLIVAPSGLKLNWRKEVKMWLGDEEHARVQVLSDGGKKIKPETRWLIISYGLLKAYEAQLTAWAPDLAIYDEAHMLKEKSAQRAQVVIGVDSKMIDPRSGGIRILHTPGLAEKTPTNWVLTGTDMQNRVMELFNLLQIIGHELGRDRIGFGKRYCDGKEVITSGHKTAWDFSGASNLKELGEKLKPVYLKRLKTEVLNLPPKIISTIPVELSPAEWAAYRKTLKDLLGKDIDAPDDGRPKLPGEALAKMTAMKQQTAIAKIPAAIDIIRTAIDGGKKIVVFSTYLAVLDKFQELFGDVAVRFDGGTPKGKRQTIVDTFQENPDTMLFLGQTDAAGVGLTLTAAQDALFNDMPWGPKPFAQACDRIYRIGQTGTCNISVLCAEGTFDDDLFEVVEDKLELIDAVDLALKEGKAIDPEVLAKANADVALQIYTRMKERARSIENDETKTAKLPKVKKGKKTEANPNVEAELT